MKKIFGALMIAVCIGMAMPAQAQLHFGVKGGLNLSKASFSDVKENFKKDNFTGFFIGPMAEFNNKAPVTADIAAPILRETVSRVVDGKVVTMYKDELEKILYKDLYSHLGLQFGG